MLRLSHVQAKASNSERPAPVCSGDDVYVSQEPRVTLADVSFSFLDYPWCEHIRWPGRSRRRCPVYRSKPKTKDRLSSAPGVGAASAPTSEPPGSRDSIARAPSDCIYLVPRLLATLVKGNASAMPTMALVSLENPCFFPLLFQLSSPKEKTTSFTQPNAHTSSRTRQGYRDFLMLP